MSKWTPRFCRKQLLINSDVTGSITSNAVVNKCIPNIGHQGKLILFQTLRCLFYVVSQKFNYFFVNRSRAIVSLRNRGPQTLDQICSTAWPLARTPLAHLMAIMACISSMEIIHKLFLASCQLLLQCICLCA